MTDILDRLEIYGKDWRDRAADVSVVHDAATEIRRLRAIIDTPENDNFIAGISREAEHQRQRWPDGHDTQKSDWDWFWLIGYLSQKAASATEFDKRKHHIITTCAALMNWHKSLTDKADNK